MIEWNKVTWYSKLVAAIVFLATFAVAFWLGFQYGALKAVPSTVSTVPQQPVSGASSTPPAGAPNIPAITGADQSETISLYVGERFAVDLGDGLNWTVSFAPSSSVESLSDSFYEAIAAGTTTLTAIGAPVCNPDQACPQFRREFTATLLIN